MREKRGAVPALVAACGGGCMNRSKTLLGYGGASPANLLLLLILCWSIPIALPSLSPSAPDPVAVGAQLGTVTKVRPLPDWGFTLILGADDSQRTPHLARHEIAAFSLLDRCLITPDGRRRLGPVQILAQMTLANPSANDPHRAMK